MCRTCDKYRATILQQELEIARLQQRLKPSFGYVEVPYSEPVRKAIDEARAAVVRLDDYRARRPTPAA